MGSWFNIVIMYQNLPKKYMIQILTNSSKSINFKNTKWDISQNYFDLLDYTFNNIVFHWIYKPKNATHRM